MKSDNEGKKWINCVAQKQINFIVLFACSHGDIGWKLKIDAKYKKSFCFRPKKLFFLRHCRFKFRLIYLFLRSFAKAICLRSGCCRFFDIREPINFWWTMRRRSNRNKLKKIALRFKIFYLFCRFLFNHFLSFHFNTKKKEFFIIFFYQSPHFGSFFGKLLLACLLSNIARS